MVGRIAVVLACVLAALPVHAGEIMTPEEARRFVVGRPFAFNCFDGTAGAGRISADGSVAGSVRFQGRGPLRYMTMPAGTVWVKGDHVCASVRGIAFEPCFTLVKIDERSFRGSLTGFNFASCKFIGQGRFEFARALRAPLPIDPTLTQSRGE